MTLTKSTKSTKSTTIPSLSVDSVCETPEEGLCIDINGVGCSFVNSLRRTIMLDTPSLGIDSVQVIKNSSSFPCEVVAQRLALTPLIQSAVFSSSKIRVHEVGPGTLYSDCVLADSGGKPQACMQPGIILLELKEGDEVHLDCNVKYGTGSDHARFCKGAKVRMKKKSESSFSLMFHSIDGLPASHHLLSAIDVLLARLDAVKADLNSNSLPNPANN